MKRFTVQVWRDARLFIEQGVEDEKTADGFFNFLVDSRKARKDRQLWEVELIDHESGMEKVWCNEFGTMTCYHG